MDATTVDRGRGEARERRALAVSEWAVVGAAALFLLSLTAFDWFAFSVEERAALGSGGDVFRWGDGFDYLLLLTGLGALTAPLARLTGLTRASPYRLAVVTGLAGLVAAIVVTYLIAAPPDVSSDSQGAVGGGPSTETIARGGAVIGLAAALAIAALSGLTLLASPAALAPLRWPRPIPAEEPAAEQPSRVSAQVRPQDELRQEVAAPTPKPRPKPAAPKRSGPTPAASRKPATTPTPKRKSAVKATTPQPKVARPKPVAPTPKRSSRPSLATASAAQLTRIGFTKAQAERIVTYRETGRVTKLAELKRVPGIAKPVLAELVKRIDE